jgi:acylphosphatase
VTGTRPAGADAPAGVIARITGRVQGVGFRYFVLGEARRLGLTGWAANRRDGSVEVRAEGRLDALDALLEALAIGPPGARVTATDVDWLPPTGAHAGFSIRGDSHPGD